jgi:hypothetical protein
MTVDPHRQAVAKPCVRFDAVELGSLDQEDDGRRQSAPPSLPANRLFLRLNAIGLLARSTGLVFRSMRPSSRSRVGADQHQSASRMASARRDRPATRRGARRTTPAGPRSWTATVAGAPAVARPAADQRIAASISWRWLIRHIARWPLVISAR